MTHVHCPECGFQNPESANYCSKCGALLIRDEPGSHTTMTFAPEDLAEGDDAAALSDLRVEGTALVVRSGGGRAGEYYTPQGERTTIGRSPECNIFLDDVTVSRKHAVLIEENGEVSIEDLGSLNGTFVNRRRIEAPTRLQSGDEVQIGKYRLSFITK